MQIPLSTGKKIYFISDFHLGVPNHESSLIREKKIVKWLDMVEQDAAAIFILGDIFDFWFEYQYTVPKGFVRLLGKIANLTDAGMPVYVFTGNHDMWMFDYLPKEIGVKIFRNPISCIIGDKKFFLGHGDGLGPGDRSYKLIKWVFANKFFQWIFSIAPPILGFGIANKWSKKSRLLNHGSDQKFLGNNEWLFQFCNETDAQQKHDYYIFGHRHLPLNMVLHSGAVYFNLGEWVNHFTYAQFDGERVELKKFE